MIKLWYIWPTRIRDCDKFQKRGKRRDAANKKNIVNMEKKSKGYHLFDPVTHLREPTHCFHRATGVSLLVRITCFSILLFSVVFQMHDERLSNLLAFADVQFQLVVAFHEIQLHIDENDKHRDEKEKGKMKKERWLSNIHDAFRSTFLRKVRLLALRDFGSFLALPIPFDITKSLTTKSLTLNTLELC